MATANTKAMASRLDARVSTRCVARSLRELLPIFEFDTQSGLNSWILGSFRLDWDFELENRVRQFVHSDILCRLIRGFALKAIFQTPSTGEFCIRRRLNQYQLSVQVAPFEMLA